MSDSDDTPVIPAFLKSMTPEELKAFVKRYNDLTPEQIREMRKKREATDGR